MKISILFLSSLFLGLWFAVSCSDDKEAVKVMDESKEATDNKIVQLTKGDSLLMEINICDDTDSNNYEQKCILDTLFMGLKQDVPSSDAFAVMIKYKNDNRPILLTQVYERDTLSRLVKLNEFKGVLLASEERSNTNFKDLLLRFIEIDGERKFFYNCWFSYSNRESKYVFNECFSINQESTQGYQFDVYSSKEATERNKVQTNREVEEILKDYGYFL